MISDILSTMHNRMQVSNARIVADLREKGWSVQPDYLGIALSDILKKRLKTLESENALTRAGIGRHSANRKAPDIRKDSTYWLDPSHPDDRLYLDLMATLRLNLNQSLILGLFEYEAHYAVYPAGGFYKKHLDALKGGRNRIVSTVCYLNENWAAQDGGFLKLYDPHHKDICLHTVTPDEGSLVVFLSEDIPHEVAPANRTRRSIAGWFRCNTSSSDKADPIL